MKKVMVDMDDVITKGGFLHLLNEYAGTSYKEEDFTNFYMQDIIEDKDDFYKFFLQKNLYDYCELVDDSYDTLKELIEYYDIYIGTAYIYREIPYNCGHILKQKYDYLIDKLPFIHPNKYIFTTDKSILNFPIKIDDRIDNLSGADLKLLFSAFHNEDLSDDYLKECNVERMNGWKDVKKRLLK